MELTSAEKFQSLIHPKNIVIVGASNDISKPGGRSTQNIVNGGYQGELYLINPKSDTIMGLPALASIDALPERIDLAIIAIPAKAVRQVLLELAAKKTKTVMIFTAGFGEVDEKGREEERRFLEIAKQHDMMLIGPNVLGVLTDTYRGKFAGIIPTLQKGTVDFISASGATIDYTMEHAEVRGLRFDNVLSLGNSIQQGVEDALALFDENHGPESAKIKLLYMESVKKPRKLLKHARSLVSKGCTIVAVKSGVTAAGKRAAASHTGAMATSDTAVQALFDKAGIIRVYSKRELIEVGCALSILGTAFKGHRACIITDAGGPGVMLSDEFNRRGWELPVLKERTQKRLLEFLPVQSSVVNPIDCLPSQTAEQTRLAFQVLEEEEKDNIDVIVIITGHSMLFDKWGTYQEIANGMDNCSIPILPAFSSSTTCADLIDRIKAQGKTYFIDEVPIGTALGQIYQRPPIFTADTTIDRYDRVEIEKVLKGCTPGALSPRACREILTAAGFKTPAQVEVFAAAELLRACQQVGFPLVMKVIGPLHKSDVGGVKVGISDTDEAEAAWQHMLAIPDAEGVLLQQMVAGTEVIIGVSREELFGHLTMFGLGGIYTEVLKDVQFGLAPLAMEESLALIRKIRSYKILEGVRGEQGVSIPVLADYLTRISILVHDFPRIKEIDLNPVKGSLENLYAVDSRIIID